LLQNALVLLAALAVGLIVAEGVVRVFELADHLVTDPIFTAAHTPHLRYHYKPRLQGRAQSNTDVRTNALGFRDLERSSAPGDRTVRLAVLGDSFTFGQGVAFPEIYTQILERELSQQVSPWRVEVMNFGVQGFTVEDEVGTYLDIAGPCHPHVALLAVVSDDLNPMRSENFVDAKGYLTKRVGGTSPLKAYLRRSRLMLLAKDAYLKWRYRGPAGPAPRRDAPDAQGPELAVLDRSLDLFLSACARDGVVPVFAMLDSWYGPTTRSILAHVRARHPELTVVDCTSAITQFPPERMVDRQTGHPGVKGHQVIARTLQEALMPLVQSCISRSSG
jgi:lysophospholipase L1-like esterase